MKNHIYYTALEIFDSETNDDFSWEKYLEWSKLTHLRELVSLDGMLNGLLVKPDYDSKYDWNYIVTDGEMITLFFKSIFFPRTSYFVPRTFYHFSLQTSSFLILILGSSRLESLFLKT